MALVLLAEYSDRIAADVARISLAAAGINAVLFDAGMASLGLGLMTPVRLMVDEDERDEAAAVLSAGG